MAKKGFTTSPRPKSLDPAAIDRFVEQGHGRDVESTERQKSANKETQMPTARLTVDMPRELHRRFKTICAAQDLRMNDEIRGFIERRLTELENG